MRLTTLLGCLTSVNVLLAFIFQWYLVITFGAGAETDALFAGMVVPQLVLAVVSGSLAHVLVPLLSTREGKNFNHDSWSVFQGMGLLFGVISLLLFFSASIWVPWSIPGFDASTKSLTISLARIQLFGMVFTALNAVLWSVHHSRQKFIWVELSAMLASLIALVGLIWGVSRFGITAAAWAMVLKVILQTILLIPFLGKYRRPDFFGDFMRDVWRRIFPLLIGTAYYKTDRLVDRMLASMAPAGGVTLLHMAQQIYAAGNTVLTKSIATPMVPLLVKQAYAGDWLSFRRILIKRYMMMGVITGLIVLIIVIIGEPILNSIFGLGSFASTNVSTLWWLLLALSGVFMCGAMGQVLSSSFYAMGNTVTPTKIGAFGFTIGIGFKLVGFYFGGIFGIALGASLYYVCNIILLNLFLLKEIRDKTLAV